MPISSTRVEPTVIVLMETVPKPPPVSTVAPLRYRNEREVWRRFWGFVNKNGPIPVYSKRWGQLDQCWVWTGSMYSGYGRMRILTVRMYAHVYSWIRHVGPTGGLNVLHKCDNHACVKPSHLWLGTIADNNADMSAKGRNGATRKWREQ